MLIPKVGIVVNYVMNSTGLEWYEFQDDVQNIKYYMDRS